MENYCISCKMPLKNKEDIGTKIEKGLVCKNCVNEDRRIKSCEEVFEGGVQFFLNSIPNADRNLAERITRKNMNNQPYWQNKENECLKGEIATDEEFQQALKKLQT